MTGDCHVRFCESRGLRCPRPLTGGKGKKHGHGKGKQASHRVGTSHR